MKTFLISALLVVSAYAECPPLEPVECGPEDRPMPCWGGIGPDDCPLPDICIPMKGPVGKDGMECPSNCPAICRNDEMPCPGGEDFLNGCTMPDFCMPVEGMIHFFHFLNKKPF